MQPINLEYNTSFLDGHKISCWPLLPSGFDFHIRRHILNAKMPFVPTETIGVDAGFGAHYAHMQSEALSLPASTFEAALLSAIKIYIQQVLQRNQMFARPAHTEKILELQPAAVCT